MTETAPIPVVQNLSWWDRVLRFAVTWAVFGVTALHLDQVQVVSWHAYVFLFGIYPMMTAMWGWDPIMHILHRKTCDRSEFNRCGSFPFEVLSAAGFRLHCFHGYDCHVRWR